MQKLNVVSHFTTAVMLLGIALGQQTPAGTQTSKPASQKAGTAAAKSPTAKKPVTTSAATGLALKTQKEKASYALGINVGTGMRRQGIDAAVDPALVARGLRDALSGRKAVLSEDEMNKALQQLGTEVRAASEAKAHAAGAPNRKAGEAFLEANKSKEGVKTLPDGLQYKVLQEGKGPKPTANDTVTVNYRGTLIDGKEFDSSYKRGQPATFPVGGVIKGWTEALQMMPVGSKWQLFIPADLAYGDNPRPGGDIAPGDTLIFDVELLSIAEQKK